jgi:hypothetical protein
MSLPDVTTLSCLPNQAKMSKLTARVKRHCKRSWYALKSSNIVSVHRIREAVTDDPNLADSAEYQGAKTPLEPEDKLARAVDVLELFGNRQIECHGDAKGRRFRREQGVADR